MTDSLTEWVTRSPIELSWTAKKRHRPPRIQVGGGRTINLVYLASILLFGLASQEFIKMVVEKGGLLLFCPNRKKWAEFNLSVLIEDKIVFSFKFLKSSLQYLRFFLAKLRSARWRAVNGEKLKIEKCWNVAGWQQISRRSSSNRRQCRAYSFLRLTATPPSPF